MIYNNKSPKQTLLFAQTPDTKFPLHSPPTTTKQMQTQSNMSLFGLGSPLLDVSIDASQELLDKYGLICPNAILASECHFPLYTEMQSSPYVPKYIAGGSSQNSVRVAQWMLGEENKTSFAGVVGDDDEGRKLTKVARDDGVNVFYSLSAKKLPTGVCGVLVHEHDRSMVTNLQAASDFSLHNLEESKHLWQNAQFMIVEGYFLNVCEESIIALGNHQLKNDRLFAFSLSAPFICEFRTKGVQNVIENSNLIIGNESEAVAFSNAMGWGLGDDDHDAIAKKIALLPFSSNLPETDTPRTRKVIITRGGSDIVISDGVQSAFYPVTPMKVEDMVDANGAGDAFCGGFLAALMKGKDDASAVQAGIFAAQIILKTSGTELEGKSANYQW